MTTKKKSKQMNKYLYFKGVHMNKSEKILLTFVGITLIIIGFILGRYSRPQNELKIIEDYSKNESTTTCNEIPQLYKELADKKIFVKCIDMLSLNIDNKKMPLSEYLKNNSVDSLISHLEATSHLNDGGTIIYKDGGTKKITDNGITLIKCNKLSDFIGSPNNQDIYIGPSSMDYEENFCKSDKKELIGKSLIYTYEVKNIEESNDENYLWLTIRKYTGEEVTSVRVPSLLSKKVKTDKNYEFTFKITDSKVDFEDTKELFEKLELLKIEETDKLGVDQINGIIQ